MEDLEDARYISLTTFKRDGTPKATPVWVTGRGGTYQFYTGADSWKAKRLRHDPHVEVRVSDMRGRVEPHTPVFTGTGEVLLDRASIEEAKAAVAEKYGWQSQLVRVLDAVKQRLGRGEDPAAIRLRLDPPEGDRA